MPEKDMADQVLTKQKLINGDRDLSDVEEILSGPPGKLVKTRKGREVYTFASVPQINTMTREEVAAAVAPKANKADVDTALSNLSTTANKFYPTLAEANYYSTTMAVNDVVTIGEEANKGLWYKATSGATSLTKSPYDPVAQAETYFDNSIIYSNNIEIYKQSNNVSNINIDPANGSIRTVSSALVNVFPIVAGETYTLTSPNFVTEYAVLAVSPNNSTTVGKTQTLVTLTAGPNANTKTFVAPINGFAFLNVKWGSPLDISTTLSINSTEFDVVIGLKGNQIKDELAHQRLDEANIETVLNEEDLSIVYPNLYDKAQKIPGFYVAVNSTLTANAGAEVVAFPILPNKTYFIKAPQFLASKIVGLSATDVATNGKSQTNRTLSATTDPNIYKFSTTSSDSSLLFAFFTTRYDSQSYDVRSSVEIYVDEVPSDTTPYIGKIKGFSLGVDSGESQPISRLANRKVFALGDSITEGKMGGYIKYLEEAFGTTISNYGSSGGRASRVVDIITAGEGLPKRDTATEATVWPTKNFTDLACVTLMIGTNDSDTNITLMGSIDQLPTGKVQDYATSNEYWALFPNNYVCNIALTIEFIRWKAPKAEIHICTPPYRNQDGVDDYGRITKLIPLLESVCRHYGVHLFYGTYECGIGYKGMSGDLNVYSYDGVHFTELGNEVFGKFFAQKVLSFG